MIASVITFRLEMIRIDRLGMRDTERDAAPPYVYIGVYWEDKTN